MVQDDFDFLWIRSDVGSGHGLFVFFPDPIHREGRFGLVRIVRGF